MNGKQAKRMRKAAKEILLDSVTRYLAEEDAKRLVAMPWEEQRKLIETDERNVSTISRKLKQEYYCG